MKLYKYIIMAIVVANIVGCSVGARMNRKSYNAAINYLPREKTTYKEEKDTLNVPKQEPYALKRGDSIIGYIMPVEYVNGKRMISLTIAQVVVYGKAIRNIPERFGKVNIDFVVKLPKELIGNVQSVVVTPFLNKNGENIPLQELTIRGALFSKVQQRNYWQYDRYKDIYKPDSVRERWAYDRFISFPYPEGVRLDSVVEHRNTMVFHYTQEVSTNDVTGNTMLVTLGGKVEALDKSSYTLPLSDTLQYNISSMLHFVDTAMRYRKEIIEKYAYVQDRNYLNFKVNDTSIIDSLADNAPQLERIEGMMNKILNQKEFYVDSIKLTASASPEGTISRNDALAKGRAYSLRNRLAARFGADVAKIMSVGWISEDWTELARLIRESDQLHFKTEILALIERDGDKDRIEREIKKRYPDDYRYIFENFYPSLRAVTFKYNLRRVWMVQDTIHTTVPDERYAEGIQLLNERKYAQALTFLGEYNDRNTAIILLSLGYDKRAYQVLCMLPDVPTNLYLRAVAAIRIGKNDEGLECFDRACEINPELKWRGRLDPEISNLIQKQENEKSN